MVVMGVTEEQEKELDMRNGWQWCKGTKADMKTRKSLAEFVCWLWVYLKLRNVFVRFSFDENIDPNTFTKMKTWKRLAVVLPVAAVVDYILFAVLVSTPAGKRSFAMLHLFAVFLVVFLLPQVYVVRWLVNRLNLAPSYARIASGCLWAFIFLPGAMTMACSRFLAKEPLEFLVMYSAICFGFTVIIDTCVGVCALVAHAARRLGLLPVGSDAMAFRSSPAGRRHVRVQRIEAAIAFLSAVALLVLGLVSAAQDPVIIPVDVPIRGLPLSLDGFRIAQVSDVHAGPTANPARIQRIVEMVNDLHPDLVALTGDIADGAYDKFGPMVAPLRLLQAPHGVFYVTGLLFSHVVDARFPIRLTLHLPGNHEYIHNGVDDWIARLRSYGIRALRNEHVRVPADAPLAESFDLAGVDDITAGRYDVGHGSDMQAALRGVPPARPVVLLSHQPATIRLAAALGVDLQLSGHVHGGQFVPWHIVAYLGNPYFAGYYRHDEATQIFVSRGAGYFGPPIRLFAPADIGLVRLRRAPEV
jgi:predicted MPP superfamily phosphohydrolase